MTRRGYRRSAREDRAMHDENVRRAIAANIAEDERWIATVRSQLDDDADCSSVLASIDPAQQQVDWQRAVVRSL
jgi:hypothetical protein